ncbi:MAG: ABC transporter ATP-binding protein [Desulfobulbaceae bacterium]|nr:ABC transporter ATP-binding protein [Desulfobulbaceae bacterium]
MNKNNQPSIIVEAKELAKSFGNRQAVKGISFSIQQGECFGFLGPNGAGKTTTIQMILGLVEKSAGELLVFGEKIPAQLKAIKRQIGVIPQNDNLDTDLTVFENLLTYASYYQMPRHKAGVRATELLQFFALDNRRHEYIRQLSGGQRRRLLLARAMMHQPQLLILDEPTVGLDPQARHLIWQRLKTLKEQGVTMMLTSHYMDEVARLSDRILVMDQGQVVAQGEPKQMVSELVGLDVFEVICSDEEALLLQTVASDCQARSERTPDGIYIYTDKDCAELDRAIRPCSQWLRRPANLEDLFIKLTGRTIHES